MTPNRKTCPHCDQDLAASARKCHACGQQLTTHDVGLPAERAPDPPANGNNLPPAEAAPSLLDDGGNGAQTSSVTGADSHTVARLTTLADKGWSAIQELAASPPDSTRDSLQRAVLSVRTSVGASVGTSVDNARTSVATAAATATTAATSAASTASAALTAWTASPVVGMLLCVGSVALLLALQVATGPLLVFWPFLLVAPISVALLRGPLWGCIAALLATAGQLLLPWLTGSIPLPPGEAATDGPRLAACAGAGILAALGTHALRQSHAAQREEAQVSRAQLRLASVTSDPSSLPVLLNAAMREVADLTGRAVCGLFLWDSARSGFVLAQQAPTAAGRENAATLPAGLFLDPTQLPALQRAMETRSPQTALRTELAACENCSALLPFPAVALVPLVNWGRVLGCFLLAGDVRGPRGRWKPAPFGDAEMMVASGFAGQVAVALENARLYDEILTQKELLAVERQKSERLLLNVLPAEIAERLKQSPEVIADSFAEVTVVFADIVDFTPLATTLPPQILVRLLNAVFSAFDALAETHGLEKIKTIGDAYMVVAGLPEPRPDHAEVAAQMALAMQHEVTRLQSETGHPLQLRIGMHTGPVIAGVIGSRKFAYDLWGDTVNTASRMESHAPPGGIQVTQATYERLREHHAFENQGVIPVKGKGDMPVYLLQGEKAENGETGH